MGGFECLLNEAAPVFSNNIVIERCLKMNKDNNNSNIIITFPMVLLIYTSENSKVMGAEKRTADRTTWRGSLVC